MSSGQLEDFGLTLAILAPLGRDAELLEKVIQQAGYQCLRCKGIEEVCDVFRKGLGAVVITEEALYLRGVDSLFKVIEQQPQWSDTPFVVLASRSSPEQQAKKTLELTRPLRNVTLIERPARTTTLANAFESVLRDRRRQYGVRDTLLELEASKAALETLNSELEQRVDERTAKLQLAVQELEGFTYSVSHDMRAPARGMIAQARIALEDYGDQIPEAAKAHLERLVDAALKMGALVDDLLKYAKLGDRKPRRNCFDLGALAEDVAAAVSEDLGCKVNLKSKRPLPVCADTELIRLVLYNLFHNSCKYRSEKAVEIELEVEERSGVPTYCVRDNGIGFDDKYAPKLFKPFERLHRDEQYPGTGIGLANVKRIVELHGGEVWAEGETDKGAAFYFTLGNGK